MTRPILLAAHLLLCAAPIVVNAQHRPLAIEDYYKVKDVGAPEISPDGRWVAYTVGSRIESGNTNEFEVWLAPTDGSVPPRRVSSGGLSSTSLAWQDGVLRFTSGQRRWFVDPSKPEQVDSTRPALTAPGAELSPNRQFIAVVRSVPVTKRTRPARSDFEQRHEERFKGVQFDWLPFMGDGRPFPLPNRNDPEVNPPQEIFIEPAQSGERAMATSGSGTTPAARQVTSLGLRPTSIGWSRDGERIVFTADSNYRSERSYGRSELYSATRNGVVRRLTPNLQYDYTGARPSPTGDWILTIRGLADNWIIGKKLNHGGATDVVIVSGDGAREVNLTANWDYLPSQPFWSTDGRHVFFTGGVGGTNHLFRVAAAGGAVVQVTRGDRRIGGLSVSADQGRMAYTVGIMERPAEVYVASMDGSGERRISNVHDELVKEIGMSAVERVQFRSRDGTPIEGWLWKPTAVGSAKHPLVVASHGGPHAADGYAFSFRNHYLAANGYYVLATNFRSSTGYGEKHLWATWGAWGTKDGQDVMAGVDHVIGRYPIDRLRVAAMGHSYGGFMTNWLITQYPDRFAAAIAGAGIVNWVSDYGNADIPITKEKEFWGAPWDTRARETMIRQSPLTYANRVKAPTLFIVGEVDQRVPYSETQQMYTALKKVGVPSRVIRYAGMAHGITGHWNIVHRMLNERAWLDQWLGAGIVP